MDGSTTTAIAPADRTEQLPVELTALLDDIGEQYAAHKAPNTIRNYHAQLKYLAQWMRLKGFNQAAADCVVEFDGEALQLPVPPTAVAMWFADRLRHNPFATKRQRHQAWIAEKHAARQAGQPEPHINDVLVPTKVSSLTTSLSAVKWVHEANGMKFDDMGNIAARIDGQNQIVPFKLWWQGLRKSNAAEARQAKPLKSDVVMDVLETIGDRIFDVRNAALISLMYSFARRRSELISLDYNVRSKGADGVLTIDADVMTIKLFNTKTGKGKVETYSIERKASPIAFTAVELWISRARIEPGTPLLRKISPMHTVLPDRLKAASVNSVVKGVMFRFFRDVQGQDEATARENAWHYTGHSGRTGFCVSAADAGVPYSRIKDTTGHKSLEMVDRYAGDRDKLRHAPHKTFGVGLRRNKKIEEVA